MRVAQAGWRKAKGWYGSRDLGDANLVLVFGGRDIADAGLRSQLSDRYPSAAIVGCTTAGEIQGASVDDDTLAVTAIRLDKTRIEVTSAACATPARSRDCGEILGRALAGPELVHVFVLSDGTRVNGTALVEGMLSGLPPGVTVSGGLAGDGSRMETTWVVCGDRCEPGIVAAIGLYGADVRVGFGCMGGWDPFGPERVITRADGNVLFELDHQPALGLYKRYLGDHAGGLPATGLLFPLELRDPAGGPPRVRTILGVDEAAGSITFAGDMPVGHRARLMHANFDRLVDGAFGAARICADRTADRPQLAILVSCVGRRLVLGDRADEELESVREVLGAIPMTGFYSNGELCPTGSIGCELHNQTMTITTIAEV